MIFAQAFECAGLKDAEGWRPDWKGIGNGEGKAGTRYALRHGGGRWRV